MDALKWTDLMQTFHGTSQYLVSTSESLWFTKTSPRSNSVKPLTSPSQTQDISLRNSAHRPRRTCHLALSPRTSLFMLHARYSCSNPKKASHWWPTPWEQRKHNGWAKPVRIHGRSKSTSTTSTCSDNSNASTARILSMLTLTKTTSRSHQTTPTGSWPSPHTAHPTLSPEATSPCGTAPTNKPISETVSFHGCLPTIRNSRTTPLVPIWLPSA